MQTRSHRDEGMKLTKEDRIWCCRTKSMCVVLIMSRGQIMLASYNKFFADCHVMVLVPRSRN